MKIIIDTREQRPWSFPAECAETTRGTLSVGDYALDGDTGFAIERKSLDDFVGTVSSGWERFTRNQLDVMDDRKMHPQVVIVEARWLDIIHHKYTSRIEPPFYLKRVAELTFRGVSVLFADDPLAAAGLAWTLFHYRMKEIEGSK